MKKLVVAGFAVAALFVAMAGDAQASGCFHRSSCAGCAPAPSDCCAPVTCVPQTVTTYQHVWKEREEVVTCYKNVAREEKFEYTVCTPVTTVEKRKVTTCQVVTKKVAYKYNVCVPVTTVEKRKQICYKTVTKEVPYVYYECVPMTTPVEQIVTRCICVPRTVECEVPCCRIALVSCCSPCGGCGWTCERVCTTRKVCRTVYEHATVQEKVTCLVTTYAKVEKKGMRQVCESVPYEQIIEVPVCTYVMQERVGERLVCETVPVVNYVDVQVCSYVHVKKVGSRTVYDCVPVKEKVKVRYCECVPTTTTVMVPCSTSSCAPSCSTHHGCFLGCFRRGCH